MSLLERQLNLAKLYPVHRLDKETSGVQLLALNSEAARAMADEFQKKTVKKIYIGLLRGQLKIPEGVWDKPLTDKAEGHKNPQGQTKDRIPCKTLYRTLKASSYFTLCEFDLQTGRQHQIRKHAALTNHALVGDPRYGETKYNTKMGSVYKTGRMFLHCSRIEIFGQTIDCPPPDIFLTIV